MGLYIPCVWLHHHPRKTVRVIFTFKKQSPAVYDGTGLSPQSFGDRQEELRFEGSLGYIARP